MVFWHVIFFEYNYKWNFYFNQTKIMTKKEFMLKVIDSLPEWKMGWGLKALIQNDQLEPDVFERLYEVFKKSVTQTFNDIQKHQMKQRMDQVNAMKQQESQQQAEESVNLDAMFSTL